MKSALLFSTLGIAIFASLYLTYIRSFVTHDFEISYSEEEIVEDVEESSLPVEETGPEATQEETEPVMNSE